MQNAGKRSVTLKALKRVLKKNGLKTTGKKATLTRRAKKAKLLKGGMWPFDNSPSKGQCASAGGMPGACQPTSQPCPGGGYPAPSKFCGS